MPMSPADTDRKIRQLDGDVQAIYEMISAVDGTLRRQQNRLDEIAADVAALDAKIDTVHDKLDAKIDTVHDKLDAKIDTVHDKLDAKIDRILQLLESDRSR